MPLRTARRRATGSNGSALARVAHVSFVLLSLGPTAGCSLQLQPDRPQCKSDQDCARFGSWFGRCADDYCVAVPCEQSSQCGSEGLCEMSDGLPRGTCAEKKSATCQSDVECARFENARVCLSSGTCGRRCNSDGECAASSKTSQCIAGACVDTTWGCLGQAAPALASDATAGFTIPIEREFADRPVPALELRVCGWELEDPGCMKPIAGATATYDPKTKLATVTGIPVADKWRLVVITPPTLNPADRLIGIDYYTQRRFEPGEMVELKQPLTVVPQQLQSMLTTLVNPESGGVPDPSKGSLLARIYDCAGVSAKNVTFGIDNLPSDSFDFYFEGLFPNPTLTRTDESGRGTFVNLKANTRYVLVPTTTSINELTRFAFSPRPALLTHVDLYPYRP